MREVLIGMAISAVIFALGFVIDLGPPWRSDVPSMAWLQVGLAWSAILIDLALIVGAIWHINISGWVVLVIFLIENVVFAWRWWALRHARRESRREQ